MATTAKIQQSKAIGWYALQRVRILDWLKPQDKDASSGDLLNSTTQAGNAEAGSSDQTNPDTTTSDADSSTASAQTDSNSQARAKSDSDSRADSKDTQKLKAVVHESHTILAKAHSVFPFQLFPDAVNIDRHKLTIVRRQFFGIEQKVSVPLENIKNIEADLGPLFGSITITSDLFINNTQKVHSLLRNEAKKIQKLVQGAVVAQGEGIDLNKIDTKQLRNLLIDLGSGHTKSM